MSPAQRAARFWARVAACAGTGCWNWQGKRGRDGYGRVWLHRRGDVRAHRFAMESTHGPIPDGLWVLHRCHNRLCCRPDHLYLGTHDENMVDMVLGRRSVKGRRSPTAKLSDDEVRAIRAAGYQGSAHRRALARQFNVDISTICRVQRHQIYQYVS
jgi:hypothetical protein